MSIVSDNFEIIQHIKQQLRNTRRVIAMNKEELKELENDTSKYIDKERISYLSNLIHFDCALLVSMEEHLNKTYGVRYLKPIGENNMGGVSDNFETMLRIEQIKEYIQGLTKTIDANKEELKTLDTGLKDYRTKERIKYLRTLIQSDEALLVSAKNHLANKYQELNLSDPILSNL